MVTLEMLQALMRQAQEDACKPSPPTFISQRQFDILFPKGDPRGK